MYGRTGLQRSVQRDLRHRFLQICARTFIPVGGVGGGERLRSGVRETAGRLAVAGV